MRFLALSLALALATASAPAAPPPSVTLTLLPAETLPGLPVSFLLTFNNLSDEPVRFGSQATLSATTATGTFDVKGLSENVYAESLPTGQMEKCNAEYCLTIAAHSQRQLYVRFGSLLVENPFLHDRRLSVPGSYILEMTLYFDHFKPPMTAIKTNPQTLTIRQPSGVDLEVWNLLQQTSGGKGWRPADWLGTGYSVIHQIRATYPSSGYAPWLAMIGPLNNPLTSELTLLNGALAANPPAALRDELLLEKGSVLQGWSKYAVFNERDADEAVNLADQARAAFTLARDVALTDYTRSQANDALAHLITRSSALEDLRFYAESDPPAPAAVIPRVECVAKGDGQSFTARFGYSNPNRVVKVLQVGPDNQVTPAPRAAGQPRFFKPGDHANVFVASSPGGNLKWHLDGSTATATADFPTQCTP